MLTRINLHLLLSEFEVKVLMFLKVAHLQLHPGAWAIIKAFQLWVEYMSWKTSCRLFFYLFSVIQTSRYNVSNQELIVLHQKVPLFSLFSRVRMICMGFSCYWSLIIWKLTPCSILFLLDPLNPTLIGFKDIGLGFISIMNLIHISFT